MGTVEDQLKSIRTAGGKTLYDTQLRRSRITALILASATIISLVFLTYAIMQKSEADRLRQELELAKQELARCSQ